MIASFAGVRAVITPGRWRTPYRTPAKPFIPNGTGILEEPFGIQGAVVEWILKDGQLWAYQYHAQPSFDIAFQDFTQVTLCGTGIGTLCRGYFYNGYLRGMLNLKVLVPR